MKIQHLICSKYHEIACPKSNSGEATLARSLPANENVKGEFDVPVGRAEQAVLSI